MWRAVIVVLAAGMLLGVFAFSLVWRLVWLDVTTPNESPAGGQDKSEIVVVAPGTNSLELLERLSSEGLIEATWATRLYAERLHKPRQLPPGEYALRASMSVVELLSKVERGEVIEHTVSVPQRATTKEVVTILAREELASTDELERDIQDPGLVEELKLDGPSLNGYLYPDVYTIPRGLSAREILKRIAARFKATVPSELFEEALKEGHSPRTVIAVASLLECEDVTRSERKLFAAVAYNRIALHMAMAGGPNAFPCLVEAHVEWAPSVVSKASRRPSRHRHGRAEHVPPTDRDPSDSDLERPAPLDPLLNPSLDAITAAAHPARTRAVYFVPRGDGTHVFCADTECYNAAVSKWRSSP